MRVLLVLALFATACTDEDAAVRTLEASGFSKITTTGFALSCGKSDTYCTGFIATGPTGKRVEGAVGCGFLKGCTIRVD